MNVKSIHITLMLGFLTCCTALVSCHVDNYPEVCNYNILLRYDYNEENTARSNMIEYYVYTIDEYIFDEAGILFQHRRFQPDMCTEYMNSELTLPAGRYSVIAIGNKDERSECNNAVPGVTRREDMLLTLKNAEQLPDNTFGPSEKLYHGYKTFTVKESGISRVRVDMINAHLTLKFRVTWKNGTTPEPGNYYALLESVPSEYSLMPEFIYPISSMDCKLHNCDTDDLFPDNCNNVIHHIPNTCYKQSNVLTHRYNSYINADNEMWGEFINYRVKPDTPLVLKLFRSADTERTADKQIVKTVDLQDYFRWCEYNLNHTLKQNYALDIEVDGNTIKISPLATIGDWDEGGVI